MKTDSKSTLHESELKEYDNRGYHLASGVLMGSDFTCIERQALRIVAEFSGNSFASLDDPSFLDFLAGNRDCERHLYGKIREFPDIETLSVHPSLHAIAKDLLNEKNVELLGKIPFRIDMPMVLRELAVWHQDYFYVKGSQNTVTAWIPLYDVKFHDGCLLVMPGSHKDGLIEHDVNVLGKKFYPSSIFDREVRYVEMNRGDVLFFDSCLLHSSGNNIGEAIRFSIQARYTGTDLESDPDMGKRISLT